MRPFVLRLSCRSLAYLIAAVAPLAALGSVYADGGCANQLPMCGAPGSGSCLTAHVGHGCDDKECCEKVCAALPDCCITDWDADCVNMANSLCGGDSSVCGGSLAVINDCSLNAIPLPIPITVAFDTTLALTDAINDACPSGRDVWYRVVAPADGQLSVIIETPFDSVLSAYDLGLYSYIDPSALPSALIACEDAQWLGGETLVLNNVTGCHQYLLRVAGYDNGLGAEGGPGSIAISYSPTVVLFDTGTPNQVFYDPELDGNAIPVWLGLTSGSLSPAAPQRWRAMPFDLPFGPDAAHRWHIESLHAYGFSPAGNFNEQLNYIVFARAGDGAPIDAMTIASGSVPFPLATDIPGGPLNEDHAIPVDLLLSGGEYWLTVYAANASNGALPSSFAWFINGQGGIPLIDPPGRATGPFMWRSTFFPDPGYEPFQFAPGVVTQMAGLDPDVVFCGGMRVEGTHTTIALCGGITAGDCGSVHETPGCADSACCESVCAGDPSCCAVKWDAMCATTAVVACNLPLACGIGGPCNVASAAPSCNDPVCCDTVCTGDPWCCVVEWDQLCVTRAILGCSTCVGACPGDLNMDSAVDGADLAALLGNWGSYGCGDLDHDGFTSGADLAQLLGNWGLCADVPPPVKKMARLTLVSVELVSGDIGTDKWNVKVKGTVNKKTGDAVYLTDKGAAGTKKMEVGDTVTMDKVLAEVSVMTGDTVTVRTESKATEEDWLGVKDIDSSDTKEQDKTFVAGTDSSTFTSTVTVLDPDKEATENPHDGSATVKFTFKLEFVDP